MSSTLHFRKTPRALKEIGSCGLPLKRVFARKFYGHDGSLGGDVIRMDEEELEWLKGVRDSEVGDDSDQRLLDKAIELIESGKSIDMWFTQ
jgi:hypothetical protein